MSLFKSLSRFPWECLPDGNCHLMLLTRLLSIEAVGRRAKYILWTAFLVTLGPIFLMPCFMALLSCSVSSSIGILAAFLPLLFTERFHTNCLLSLCDNSENTKKNWVKHSSAYLVLCEPLALQESMMYLYCCTIRSPTPSLIALRKLKNKKQSARIAQL